MSGTSGTGGAGGVDPGDYEYALAHRDEADEHAPGERERPLVQVSREDDAGEGDWSYAMAHDVPRTGRPGSPTR